MILKLTKMKRSIRRFKVYLSGPISGYDTNERKAAFKDVENVLWLLGFDVVNPMDISDSSALYHECMRADLKVLLDCDYIYLLAGWKKSKGAKIEYKVAKTCGIKVLGRDML